jgi:hypothetical protein
MMNIVLRNEKAREWKSLTCGLEPEALASRKGESSDALSEVSGTAKLCTDEQELHRRHKWMDEQAHHCKVLNDESSYVHAAAIQRRLFILPGEVSKVCLNQRRSQQRS